MIDETRYTGEDYQRVMQIVSWHCFSDKNCVRLVSSVNCNGSRDSFLSQAFGSLCLVFGIILSKISYWREKITLLFKRKSSGHKITS